MAVVHKNFQDLAVKLITANGRPIKVVRTTLNASTTQPWKIGDPSLARTSTVGAFFKGESTDLLVATLQAIGAPEGARTSMGTRESTLLIPARDIPFEILPKHTIEDGATTWEIKEVEIVQPGPTRILYICTVGR